MSPNVFCDTFVQLENKFPMKIQRLIGLEKNIASYAAQRRKLL